MRSEQEVIAATSEQGTILAKHIDKREFEARQILKDRHLHSTTMQEQAEK